MSSRTLHQGVLAIKAVIYSSVLATALALSGCATVDVGSGNDIATSSNRSSLSTPAKSGTEAAVKLGNLAQSAQQTQALCGQECDDIDAVAHPEDISDGVSDDDIDAQPVLDDVEFDEEMDDNEQHRLG
nr:hypothetical protein [Psychrobacter sp. PraFG1]UNK04495.1 hypothetical protein MN210_09310 [Psychrobacter sp. PraFG1]